MSNNENNVLDINTIKPLRPTSELETILATQIVLNCMKSVEDGIDKSDNDALEYGAQALSDDLRIKVSHKSNLPDNIIYHLLKDRLPLVRWNILDRYFNKLTQEMQAKAHVEAAQVYKETQGIIRYGTPNYIILNIYRKILRDIFRNGDDEQFAKISKNIGWGTEHEQMDPPHFITEDPAYLRDNMPLTNRLFQQNNKDAPVYFNNLAIINTNTEYRAEVIKKVLKLSASELRSYFSDICNASYSRYGRATKKTKTEMYLFLVTDPDVNIRKMVLNTITDREALKYMAEHDKDPLLKHKANQKFIKYQRRAEYARKYHQKRLAGSK